jgi:hypothetical protein
MKPSIEIESDPVVWRHVESLIRAQLPPVPVNQRRATERDGGLKRQDWFGLADRQWRRAAIRHTPPRRNRHARRLAHAGTGSPTAAGYRLAGLDGLLRWDVGKSPRSTCVNFCVSVKRVVENLVLDALFPGHHGIEGSGATGRRPPASVSLEPYMV